jgi:hypothetical protein
METINLGFISIIRTTFDVALATEITGQVRQQLTLAGFRP